MKIVQSKILKNFSNLMNGFTTRDAGVSQKPYDSLNLALHVGDSIDDVLQNHQLLADSLAYDKKTVVHMRQIHSNTIHIVDDNDNFNNPPLCDALITDRTNTPLMVMVADCSPILFYDNEKKVIAVAHAGRAGAFNNIVKNTVDSFSDDFNSKTQNILVSIGSSIGVCCYEVGVEIYEEVKKLNLEYAIEKKSDAYYLDIKKILKRQLLESGVCEENIEISDECSCCENKKYFSYRADGVTGRFCGIIGLLA